MCSSGTVKYNTWKLYSEIYNKIDISKIINKFIYHICSAALPDAAPGLLVEDEVSKHLHNNIPDI